MAASTEVAAAAVVAVEYQTQVAQVGDALALAVARMWRGSAAGRSQLDRLFRLAGGVAGARTAAFAGVVPEAVAAFAAAQMVVAEMADAYVGDVLAAQGQASAAAGLVVPESFAGVAASGLSLESLLLLPAQRADRAVAEGLDSRVAETRALAQLRMYSATEVADAARLSSAASGVSHRVGGYIRRLRTPSCSRCAILAGRWYRYSAGFSRHP